MKNKIIEDKLERVELATIYRDNKGMGISYNIDAKDYEMFGFLKCLVNDMEKELTEKLVESNDET